MHLSLYTEGDRNPVYDFEKMRLALPEDVGEGRELRAQLAPERAKVGKNELND
jgi:hypothetical protein